MTIMDRVLPRLEWFGDCLLWTGSFFPNGYGQVTEKADGRWTSLGVHRVVYRETIGNVDGWMVLHTCDVRGCCNPDHLFLGTHQDNMDDMVLKGRQRQGDRSGTRLNECQRGHPMSGENLYIYPNGKRQCGTCMRAAARASYHRRKASA